MAEVSGLIFDLQAHSVHDGPGCRTLVFLSGCPLRCEWCSNPEGWEVRPRVMFSSMKCKQREWNCTRCVEACPRGAIKVADDPEAEQQIVIDRSLCEECTTYECVAACRVEGLRLCGRLWTADEFMRIMNRDRQYWGPGGGVTFTGGEPLVQKDFILELLRRCRRDYIHAAIETTGHAEPEFFMEALSLVEFAFVDIKLMDPERHRRWTGVTNELILANITALAGDSWSGRLVIRTPIIPGVNDDDENIVATAEFMRDVGLEEINILPFHRLGDSKWTQLGLVYPFKDQESPSRETMERIQGLFKDKGLVCYVGYETPF
ncbi:MAG TPA: glycyl-radical enzyme activating protein [Clostridiales bacterium]|nr:glycyl-radical enzyme activating protein [Clostridiales bacterium]